MITVIQFREDITEQHEQTCIANHLRKGQKLRFVSIFDASQPFTNPAELLKDSTHLILGGSAGLSMGPGHQNNDYKKVDYILRTIKPLILYVLQHDFPTLGTCFGHHLLGYFSGAPVVYDHALAETGAYQITLTPDGLHDTIFAGVPKTFYAIEGHQDSLASVPKNATLLASSQNCKVQALRYGKHVYSTQFHSEMNDRDAQYRLKLFPHYAKHANGDSLNMPASPYSVAPLKNFMNIDKQH